MPTGISAPALYVAVSRHGYGHATRVASIVGEARGLLPDLRIVVAADVPRSLLAAYIGGPFELRPVALDAGVVQPDSLTIDVAATLRAASDVQSRQHDIVSGEVGYLKRSGVRLVLADIPPLATALADAARVPCWMVSNFGWDFIYGAWGPAFRHVVAWIEDCHALCERVFRLPFHEPMGSFPQIVDAGLTGGRPRWEPADAARRLGIDHPRERTALVTLGGFGRHRIPYEALARYPEWLFLVFDPEAPCAGNVVPLRDAGVRPVDLMPLCARVIAKPGFSTFSEAIRSGVPIVTVPRPGFAEAEILVAGMRDCAPHQIVGLDDFLSGDWSFLERPTDPARFGQGVRMDGTESIGRSVAEYLGSA